MIILIDNKPTLCKESLVFELLSKNFLIQFEYMDDSSVMDELCEVLLGAEFFAPPPLVSYIRHTTVIQAFRITIITPNNAHVCNYRKDESLWGGVACIFNECHFKWKNSEICSDVGLLKLNG